MSEPFEGHEDTVIGGDVLALRAEVQRLRAQAAAGERLAERMRLLGLHRTSGDEEALAAWDAAKEPRTATKEPSP